MKIIITIIFIFSFNYLDAQEFTRKDSLRGGFHFERTCYDVKRYDLDIIINPEEKSIQGFNEISFQVLQNTTKIQLDLFDNMNVDSLVFEQKKLNFSREFNAVFVNFKEEIKASEQIKKIKFYYSGNPKIAKNAPWDGGFVFKKDKNQKHWIGVAVQGTGASLWYPVKDSQSDEPDFGASIKVAVPDGLMNVSNGNFLGKENLKNGYTRWDWEVQNPINTYNITVNIGDYVQIHDEHNGLNLDYYVLRGNEEIAKKHFSIVKPMMDCFEEKFGEYPFKNDGYKLVETAYLGMEHQSAVAYGNKFQMGYLGSDISSTGIGLLFDYIVVHESAHEWFGNSITSQDIADLWIHEGFTTYSESVFVECLYGKEKAFEYLKGQKNRVANSSPVIGKFGVNKAGSSDAYFKGAQMLHTLRNILNDDSHWWKILREFAETYKHQIVDREMVVSFFNKKFNYNLNPFFAQYLEYTNIPELEFFQTKKELTLRFVTDVKNFKMPIWINIDGVDHKIEISNNWTSVKIKKRSDINFHESHFYIKLFKQKL
ncbi:M1 family peptidase [Flavobacterium sp. NST-5]|uniref:M1 family peptidase n=1 Tax=Flavobacterium ichthyis TaxID=2698827 RepID=A0ABW9Z5N7_9FLAO|nr:M1 family metallopeptidase [Flavobacterium ichthyis]NBL64157.1 M1 family peptidase [Flavobacterium ichthyis]